MGVRAVGFGLKDPPDCTRLLIVLQTIFFPFNYFRMSFLARLFYSTLRIRLGCCGGWLCRVLWRRCAHTQEELACRAVENHFAETERERIA